MTFYGIDFCKCTCHSIATVYHMFPCCIKCDICNGRVLSASKLKHYEWHKLGNNDSKGRLIVFEGIDGSGKTTQMKMLSDRLWNNAKISHKIIRDPGSTDLSEKVRKILLDLKKDKDGVIGNRAECLLFLAARAQLVQDVIKPALEKGELILCDRFSDSTTAYQGYGRELPLVEIYKAQELALDHVTPDLRILIDIDLDIVKERMSNRKINRMEKVGNSFRKRVKDGYLYIAKNSQSPWLVISGNESKEKIAKQIYDNVERFIGESDVN